MAVTIPEIPAPTQTTLSGLLPSMGRSSTKTCVLAAIAPNGSEKVVSVALA